MSDSAGGRTIENTVNYLLAECSYGKVDQNNNWIPASTIPSVEAPLDKNLISYKKFIDQLHPYQTDSSTHDLAEMKQNNKLIKKKRTALQSAFTDRNAPGETLVKSFREVLDRMLFPIGEARKKAKEVAETLDEGQLKEAWKQGRYFLLPSFIKALYYLAGLNQSQQETQHCIIFRTFGNDIPDVAKEIEFLVEGSHPLFPGKKLDQDMTLRAPYGTFYRTGFDSEDTYLTMGTLDKIPFDANVATDPEEYFKGQSINVIRGFESIDDFIQQYLNNNSVIGLRDYWELWHAHGEKAEYGKLLVVDDKQGSSSLHVHSVFFDDHVESNTAHIVDVRSKTSGTPIDFHKSIHHYLERAEPYSAITDEDYFTKMISVERIPPSASA